MRIGRRRLFLVGLGVAVVGSLGGPGVGVTTRSASETPAASIANKVNALMAQMTIDEKLGQLQQQVPQLPGVLETQARNGMLGAVLDLTGATNHNGGAIHFGLDGKLCTSRSSSAWTPSMGTAPSFQSRLGRRAASIPASAVPMPRWELTSRRTTASSRCSHR